MFLHSRHGCSQTVITNKLSTESMVHFLHFPRPITLFALYLGVVLLS
ncbi:hypothetical protein HMPREF1364_00417 [Enterococcus faecium ERV165]|nr:hypothetical protein HMPREF1364_00417 [Enterococcus faecium ERV165]EJY14083.1 hypothetical protein HMPREF1360_00862 [Enterococcus faecium E422]EJY18237.1 hypothetical protein HMPREF1358_01140 [Enterococcus faecium C621]EPI24913.1 hypothetical protein D352_00520 [Enterococcus faecium LA4B-2]